MDVVQQAWYPLTDSHCMLQYQHRWLSRPATSTLTPWKASGEECHHGNGTVQYYRTIEIKRHCKDDRVTTGCHPPPCSTLASLPTQDTNMAGPLKRTTNLTGLAVATNPRQVIFYS
ncbi:hypothetical protein TrispH2_003783 [Trichoplax sp. H2]|nr:hypothetical protein TrispH2_003783 [Trichoplax sp. H2]|eukprot:RDD44552.1 hypothetical protein TrispH2_003783 [Trichoplax sp. H2]